MYKMIPAIILNKYLFTAGIMETGLAITPPPKKQKQNKTR